MTVRLLADYPLPGGAVAPAGKVVNVFSSATETGLIAAGLAVASAATVDWYPPVSTRAPSQLSGSEVAALSVTGKLSKLRAAIEAASRKNALTEAPYAPASSWTASTTIENVGTIVRGIGAGNTTNIYMYVGTTTVVQGSGGVTAAATGPTGTGPGLITDNTAVWQYIGQATSAGTYPLWSTVVPVASTDVMNGYLAIVNQSTMAALGLGTYPHFPNDTAATPSLTCFNHTMTDAVTPVPSNSGTALAPVRAVAGLNWVGTFVTNAKKWVGVWHINNIAAGYPVKAIKINGQFLTEEIAIKVTAARAVNPGVLLIDVSKFGSGPKVIEFWGNQTYSQVISRIAVGANEYVYPYKHPNDYKIAIEGDSIGNGSYFAPQYAADMMPFALRELLGVSGVYNNCIGSTGVLQVNSFTNYPQRLPDIVAYNPDMVLIYGSHNETAGTELTAGMTTYLQQVRAALPNATIVLLGGVTLQGSATESTAQTANEVCYKAAFDAVLGSDANALFIPVWTAAVPLLTAPPANGYFFQAGGSPAPYTDAHPTPWYYRHFNQVIANAIRNWVAGEGVV